MKKIKVYIVLFLVIILTTPILLSQENSNKIVRYRVNNRFQADYTKVRVLTPDNFDSNKEYKVLYILPVI